MDEDETTLYLSITGPIDDTNAALILKEIQERLAKNYRYRKLHILLACPGGTVDGGIFLYDGLQRLPITVVTHNVAFVNSIGVTIFLAGDERYAEPYANFMLHGAAMSFGNSAADIPTLKDKLGELRHAEARMKSIFRDRIHTSETTLRSFFASSRRDLSPSEALTYGFLTSLEVPLIPKDAKSRWIICTYKG